ncbi:MAG: NAD(P)H-dependent oxidoreductase [Candidatus Obscuribacterales bacterium]|nr:NAD(P)H-dependent oxidoreductase [Candidatus Obscuribacterales bacterium]
MAKILHVDSSSRSKNSNSRQLSKYFVEKWIETHPADSVIYRDLVQDSLVPLTDTVISAMYTPPEQRTEAMSSDYATLIDKNVQEVIDADIYVFGVPMYNFSVPGAFKSYIDRIVVVGRTFSYGADGLKGLLQNKKAFILRSSGSNFDGPPYASMDFHEPYLRAIFGFIGISDITFVKVDGHSEEEISAAMKKAKEQIDHLTAEQKLVSAGR